MQLDYIINEVFNNYHKEGSVVYESVGWEVTIFNNRLLDSVNFDLESNIELNKCTTVSKEFALEMWGLVRGSKDLIGSFGDRFLNE